MANNEKTPVSLLQELATKKNPNESPVYTDILETPEEFADSKFRFFMQCEALGFTSIGGGDTKKAAKHSSAVKLLGKLPESEGETVVEKQPSIEENYISDLLNFCKVKGFQEPEFECMSASGPFHAPVFNFRCKVDSIEKIVGAKNKKLAKQLSAKEVYDVLKTSNPDVQVKIAATNKVPKQNLGNVRITTYEFKKKNNVVESNGTPKENPKFFKIQDRELVKSLLQVLQADVTDEDNFKKIVTEVEKVWPVKIGKFIEPTLTRFEVKFEREEFACILTGTAETLMEMMDVKNESEVVEE